MKVLVTGADGFIGRNLCVHLAERKDVEVVRFTLENSLSELPELVKDIGAVIHLAGVNRPKDPAEFKEGNADLTVSLCNALLAANKAVSFICSSSIQAALDNPYGASKKDAEDAVFEYAKQSGGKAFVYRLPNVFGKWSQPNYNSAVATFCHNIAQGLPIQINDPNAMINLVYVDDVVADFIKVLDGQVSVDGFQDVQPVYPISVGDLAKQIQAFKDSRDTLITENVGTGLVRALYSTYVSFLKPEQFSYGIPKYGDERGVFVEMLKTQEAGQFSYFTAHPGITRGGHYHHSKTEKFLVIKGKASFKFRHMVTGEFYELFTSGDKPEIVETVTGWTHDITNVGDEEMIVMLWANEIFDREKPDTYACPVVKSKE